MIIDYSEDEILEDIRIVPSKAAITDEEVALVGMALLRVLPKKSDPESAWRLFSRIEAIQRLT